MKRKTFYLIYAVIAIALIAIFGLKDYDVSKGQWKISEGKGHIGDWIEFKNQPYTIKEDTIYRNSQPLAVIKKATKHKMQIINLLNGEDAIYINKVK